MLNAVSNYNTLGKVGPHYERPEYRPPAGGNNEEQPARAAGDRRTLTRSGPPTGRTDAKPAPAPVPARLNLAGARNLAAALAAQISILPPQSTDREPHAWLRTSLLTPIYV
ncbi:MAG: hypothetical protein FWG97_03595 [Deltaproteobacteria bacterium]|nr:hypothetical protein [Deltaproteobacteria bacterium]